MPTRSKLLFVGFAAALVLSLAVSSALARRLSFSAGRYQAIWPLMKFEEPGTFTMQCPVTLEGSFHSASISKVSGALIGYVTSAKIRGGSTECLNTGTARLNTETLPWHLRYQSFVGTLPNITGILLQTVNGTFEVHPAGLPQCLARSTAANPAVGIVELTGGVARAQRADETRTIPIGGEFFCEIAGGRANFSGTAEVFVQGSTTTRINVRLVQ